MASCFGGWRRCCTAMAASMAHLPADVQSLVLSYLRAAEILNAAPTAKAFALARDDAMLWESVFSAAVRAAVAACSGAGRVDADVAAVERALGDRADGAACCPRATTLRAWVKLKHLAPAACAVAARRSQHKCILSLHGRVFDVTRFLDGWPYEHPGGRETLATHHGRDAAKAFEAFGHSHTAHALMRREFMLFDGPAHLGTYVFPALMGKRARIARGSLHTFGGPGATYRPSSSRLVLFAVLAAAGAVASRCAPAPLSFG